MDNHKVGRFFEIQCRSELLASLGWDATPTQCTTVQWSAHVQAIRCCGFGEKCAKNR